MSKYQANQVFGPVDRKLAESLTVEEIGTLLSNKEIVPYSSTHTVNFECSGRKITGDQFCALFEHFASVINHSAVAPKVPQHSQSAYEAAYWNYVNYSGDDVNEPPRLLQAMTDQILSLDITHVIDKKKSSFRSILTLGIALPIFAYLVFYLLLVIGVL